MEARLVCFAWLHVFACASIRPRTNSKKGCMMNLRWYVGDRVLWMMCVVTLLSVSLCAAEENSSESAGNGVSSKLTDVVVTAAGYPQRRENIPASVTVVDGNDIESTPARNIDDVLRSVPGVSLLQTVGMGYGLPSQINVRGVPGQHAVLVLMDGMPLNEALGGFMNISQAPVQSIKQVEVVRGPFSSLYGADAFAGVINMITLAPEDMPRGDVRGSMGGACRDGDA